MTEFEFKKYPKIYRIGHEDVEDIFNDPQLKHRDHFVILDNREIGPHSYNSPGFILSRTPAKPQLPAPCMGEHNAYVCTEILGLSDETFVELMSQGGFG